MKKLLFSALFVGGILIAQAQAVKTPSPSTSQTVKQEFGLGSIELSYSRPNMKGRETWFPIMRYGVPEPTLLQLLHSAMK
jgi:hypothetical protein